MEIKEIISPRYGSLTAYNDLSALNTLPDTPYKIRVIDEEREIVFQSDTGELIVEKVLPGQYTLLFEEDEKVTFPPAVLLNIHPGEKVGPLVGKYKNMEAYFSLFTNKEINWKVMKDGEVVLLGEGERVEALLSSGNGYDLRTQSIHGYIKTQKPNHLFSLERGEHYRADVYYESAFGEVVINSYYPFEESLTFTLKPIHLQEKEKSTLYQVDALGGQVYWKETLPVGRYLLSFNRINGVEPIDAMEIVVNKGNNIIGMV